MARLDTSTGHAGLRVIHEDHPSYVPFAEHDRRADNATINVTYRGFPPGAQAALQRAVDIWAATVSSPVPIWVDAVFEPLAENTLGAAGPHSMFQNFPGAPVPNTFFPRALADRLAGRDLSPGSPDIDAFFSSAANWYFGIDGHPPPGQLDFVSVVLHELGHGLGLVGSGELDDSGQAAWGLGAPRQHFLCFDFGLVFPQVLHKIHVRASSTFG